MRVIRSISDLSALEIDWILGRARQHRSGESHHPARSPTVVGLAFFEVSLRTRVGFAAAAARLGAATVEVLNVRSSPVSMPESVEDTIRTLSGYVDAVIVRSDGPLLVPADLTVPVLSGGDRGPAGEHPSQALIDLFALQQLSLDLGALTIALCGDLRMRASRSLLLLLAERRPKRIVVVTEPPLLDGLVLPPAIVDSVEFRTLGSLGDVDALYVTGIPHKALDQDGRTRLRVAKAHLDRLPVHARVLSPLPVIDEMERDCLTHPAVRVFEQSDDGLFVRMAMLEFLLGDGPKDGPR